MGYVTPFLHCAEIQQTLPHFTDREAETQVEESTSLGLWSGAFRLKLSAT